MHEEKIVTKYVVNGLSFDSEDEARNQLYTEQLMDIINPSKSPIISQQANHTFEFIMNNKLAIFNLLNNFMSIKFIHEAEREKMFSSVVDTK